MKQLTRKQPRDFIWQDDFQCAKDDWPESYPGSKVWVNIHEYRAMLAGDASYLRLLISGAHDCNLVWQTTPDGAHELHRLLSNLKMPISFKELKKSGFSYVKDTDY